MKDEVSVDDKEKINLEIKENEVLFPNLENIINEQEINKKN